MILLKRCGKLYIEDNLSKSEIADLLNVPKNNIIYCIKLGKFKKDIDSQSQCRKRVLVEKYGVEVPLKNKDVVEKLKRTNLEKYGVDNPMKSDIIKQKAVNTNIKKYGVKYIMQSEEFKEKSVNTSKRKYNTKSPMQSDVIKQKWISNFNSKYGVNNPMQLDEFKNKVYETNLKKYGTISPLCNNEIKLQIKEKNKLKYGSETPISTDEVRQKIEKTNLEKYGSKSPLGNKDIINKTRLTWQKRYGVDNPLKSTVVRDKIEKTNLEKYGSKSPLGNKDIQNKIHQTNLKKYGCLYPLQNQEIHNKATDTNIDKNCKAYDILRDREKLIATLLQIPEKERTSIKCAETLGVNITTFRKWYVYHNIQADVHLQAQRSHFEQDIYNWLKSNYNEKIECNVRYFGKYELDIYLPDAKIGIEFNGMYWHSTDMVGTKYHQKKSLYFKDLGIFIFHIYEWEWLDVNIQNKIKQHLEMLLNIVDVNVIYARKCLIQNIDNNTYKDFLNKYHLQGYVPAQIKLGLFYNNELLQVMSFAPARYFNEGYELIRLCTKFKYKIVGGANKLFKYFVRNYQQKNIISYCDIDKFEGNIYTKLGMKLDKINIPNYKWVNLKTLDIKSRYQTQKHLIKVDDNDTRSEREIMSDLGYVKVENAGTYRFIYEEVDINEDKIDKKD